MAAKLPARTYTITTNGRTVIADASTPRLADGVVEFAVLAGGTLGGGTLSGQGSYEDAPNTGTTAHWATVAGMETLEVGKLYRMQIGAETAALNLTGATSPSLTIVAR